eukprot:TRINITY_DN2345_c2_g1_i1.p1 TRINITY_DN2345_c2_g1~~TRINITY_DN2345_c2_g1_i1.p1  ORF type:complete len:159 (+),score=22.68 TRINITY_DN2345_c2_g1_i1:16-492(+)
MRKRFLDPGCGLWPYGYLIPESNRSKVFVSLSMRPTFFQQTSHAKHMVTYSKRQQRGSYPQGQKPKGPGAHKLGKPKESPQDGQAKRTKKQRADRLGQPKAKEAQSLTQFHEQPSKGVQPEQKQNRAKHSPFRSSRKHMKTGSPQQNFRHHGFLYNFA